MSGVLHSKATPRWGSPADLVERGRRLMGGIDLDPCTEEAFQAVVQAKTAYSLIDRGENGLKLPWSGRVFCNHPGGDTRSFWDKLCSESSRPGGVDQCIWVGFSVEQLCLLADAEQHPADFSLCILRKRPSFVRHDGFQGSPSHGGYVCALGVPHDAFVREFGELGKVIAGPYAAP